MTMWLQLANHNDSLRQRRAEQGHDCAGDRLQLRLFREQLGTMWRWQQIERLHQQSDSNISSHQQRYRIVGFVWMLQVSKILF